MTKPYYIILTSNSIPDLKDKVNNHHDCGYRLHEGMVTYGDNEHGIMFTQAMVLEGLSIPENIVWTDIGDK
jgi:hypothetical protein